MVKKRDLVNIEKQALDALRKALADVPDIQALEVDVADPLAGSPVDLVCHITFNGQKRLLVGEVKSNGQPRHVQSALFELTRYVEKQQGSVTPIFVAPYLSEDARALCIDNNVGYLDLEGNARITFPGFFMSRSVAGKPTAERRELRSMFKPQSAAVLRTMLREPGKSWRVADLASAALVSVGHVSNVRNSLMDRGWAESTDKGVHLSNPDGLLDAWRDEYVPPTGERQKFYTTLHGSALEEALRNCGTALALDGIAILSSFSAATWQAPYARTGSHHFYADHEGVERLRKLLNLSSATRGENVQITVIDDIGLFRDSVEAAPGIHCTSLVQTYLDLYASGERGREAAEHLRHERLQWKK